ncbi:MAG: acyl-protein synthetase [Candidatus Magnetomorum sp.]|nr:acyl-protein synthetase [Candidatus Magnetomorum sp.]
MKSIEDIFQLDSPYLLTKDQKKKMLDPYLHDLDNLHYEKCISYRKIVDAIPGGRNKQSDLYLPVRLFKNFDLRSISSDQILKTLTSSGTTSQQVSKIYIDKITAINQTKALVKIMQHYIGKNRLPMLIIDHPNVIKDRTLFSARGAGIRGLWTFGRNHTYALDNEMNVDDDAIDAFIEKFKHQKSIIFGFTFMIWKYFIQELEKQGRTIDLCNSIVFHSGGWKKLQDDAVDNETFKSKVKQLTEVSHVHNFYGMVEQVGTIYVECEKGYLHAPIFSDVKILDPATMKERPHKQSGVIAVESILPVSYPGHRLLTEDLGTVMGEDDCECGKKGKYFLIHGRLKKAEIRGCSDTYAVE